MTTEQPKLLPLPTDNILIPSKQISLYTGIATQTHTRWRHEGIGPIYVRLGRRVFYRADDVREWIDSNYRSTTQQGQKLKQLDSRLCDSKIKP